MQKAIVLLAQTLSYPWQISELADAVGVQRKQLERCFRKATQQSPGQYLHLLRLQTTAHRLRTSDDEIAVIAQQVGFADVRYFRRSFKAWAKKTPSEYRQQPVAAHELLPPATAKMSQFSPLSKIEPSLR